MTYTISIFALARNCLARFDLNFSYLLFCRSVFSSFLTSASGLLCGGVCAFNRRMVKAVSTWINPVISQARMARNVFTICGDNLSAATAL